MPSQKRLLTCRTSVLDVGGTPEVIVGSVVPQFVDTVDGEGRLSQLGQVPDPHLLATPPSLPCHAPSLPLGVISLLHQLALGEGEGEGLLVSGVRDIAGVLVVSGNAKGRETNAVSKHGTITNKGHG